MYDKAKEQWRFRQTGIMVAVPKLMGQIFVGRTRHQMDGQRSKRRVETYYRPGPLMFGTEYFFNQVHSCESNDPFFHGGEVFVSYLMTGETRPYNARGAYFERVSPSRTVFEGGPGAWENVLRYSVALPLRTLNHAAARRAADLRPAGACVRSL
jgi:phosphate-selective porin